MSVENIDKVIVNEEGEEVVELSIEEYESLSEALHTYQKENSLLEVHVSQLQDHIAKLEKEIDALKAKPHKNNQIRMKIMEMSDAL